jgi:Carboxypeptidase regulatory-like domain
VRKAIVRLSWLEMSGCWAAQMTDGSGQFSFDRLPPGRYELHASKAGTGAAAYGADAPNDFSDLLTLAPGEGRRGIELRLVRPSSISGTALDADGDPIIGTHVGLFREGYPRGARELVQVTETLTNDRGEFRLANLPPGPYYVTAGQYSVGGAFPVQGGSMEVYARQFYGGTTDWKHAARIEVRSGEPVSGIDFRLSLVGSFRLRGRLSGLPERQGPSGAIPPGMVELIGPIGAGTVRSTAGTGAAPPAYEFQLLNVLPGSYLLGAEVSTDPKPWYALQRLDLKEDPGEITLALAPPTVLKGEVRFEGEPSKPGQIFHVSLAPGDLARGPDQRLSTETAPDGRFTFEQVPPGVWDINVSPIPKGGYIKAMRLGDQDVLTEDMEISAATNAPLHIVVSSRGAVVEGQVEGGQEFHRTIAIQLVPTGKFHHVMSFYQSTPADAEGKFELTGVTPGQYKIFAFEHLPPGGMQNPDLTAKIDALGEALEITEGAHVEAHPRVITPEQIRKALP